MIQLIQDLKEATKPMGLDNAIGRVSRMDYINNKTIEQWLSTYDSNKFGKCIRCGNEININRLLLIPSSKHCIYCAGR